jgi:LAS superfamily LD-carboxypeptidase LdcB
MSQLSIAQILGQATEHVRACPPWPVLLNKDTARALLALRKRALKDGIDLWPVSGFRSYATQVAIWSQKWQGKRQLYDRNQRRVDPKRLTAQQRLAAILAWSAPPGASRHHWGSDVDVVDLAVVKRGYQPKLVPAEYEGSGPMAALGQWLTAQLKASEFYRPYTHDRGGVQPEPWHLSFQPVAMQCSKRLRERHLVAALAALDEPWAKLLIAQMPTIYRQYVRSVDKP